MARNSKPSPETANNVPSTHSRKPFVSDVRWANPHLDKSDIHALESSVGEQHVFIAELLASLAEADSLTVKYDSKANRYIAVLFVPDGDAPERKLGISLRAATASDALYALSWYCVVKAQWRFDSISDDRPSRFG